MQNPNLAIEISALEQQLNTYKNLLENAISDDVIFAETKVIFHQVKVLTDKLIILKNLSNDELKINKNGERTNSNEL